MKKPLVSFTQDDYEITEKKIAHEGIFNLLHYKLRHRLFDGGWGKIVHREVLEKRPAVAVLLYDPKLDKVVLIQQFRPGALSAKNPWLIEIVAGVIDSNESPEVVAKREAKEEAGCSVSELHLIYDHFVTPGCSTEYLYLYWGKVDASKVSGIHGLAKENEDISAFTLSAKEAFAMLHANQIKTVPALIALQWLELNHSKLRKK